MGLEHKDYRPTGGAGSGLVVDGAGIEGYGLSIVDSVPLVIEPNDHNAHYLRTKAVRMGHTLEVEEAP